MRRVKHDEFSLIRYLTEKRAPSSRNEEEHEAGVLVGIGDDAAVMDWPAGARLVMSCDAMVEHVHFSATTSRPYHIGYKAAASTISDIAAMGGAAKYVTVSLVLPARIEAEWLRAMYDGIFDCLHRYGVALVGGDTVSTRGDLAVSLTAVGMLPVGQEPLCRSAARAGDVVFLTNQVGLAAAGLHALLNGAQPEQLMAEHMAPQPQMQAGALFGASGLVHALNDVSDGLASEAWEIAEASGAGLLLDERALPIAEALREYADLTGLDPLPWMLYGGEDYQLIGTTSSAAWPALHRMCGEQGIAVCAIGTVSDAFVGVRLRFADGREQAIEKKGYNHFPDKAE